jgi:hypothetical protein
MTDGAFFGSSPSPRAWRRTDPFPSEDEIADRAYELFVAGGRRIEHAADYWRRAQDELLDGAARRIR